MNAEWAKPGGWRHDIENRAAINARSMGTYYTWKRSLEDYDWPITKELDPREWIDVHSQGNIGSCQAHSLTECYEFNYWLKYGPDEIQLSRFWAYRVSQLEDNINSDQGSTLEGGGRAAATVGICLESSFPYPSTFSAGSSFFNANKARLAPEAAKYKLLGEVPLNSWDDILLFLKTRTGAVATGIMWGSSNDVEWEQKSYTPGSGGHSTTLVGYLPVESWPDGVGLLHLNSWSENWGRGGYSLLHKNAVEAMLRTKYNLFVGRTEPLAPVPNVNPDL